MALFTITSNAVVLLEAYKLIERAEKVYILKKLLCMFGLTSV
jgi:hypothetical protein